ncbi:radical SAM protein [Intestinimonas massiliensis]|uniref:Radical SAM protein n=1 Tax=Intestinimonas massiliensis (ex Afouda et al. 2020) TaxID=1673721 RepID=A0ABS9M5Z9_9FIRM|nr:radical SAM protein [Intestinimonas massiliensis (ex Afouda et al. 2020)]MCG4526190.1 radical SAM protein [Intestinimonas massiliensis (ex Afouda et al. 2020)]MCQ4805913.1 radical SAM protein [Intestinimonas massiliensis (ex Afouda et al. 2020)]
MRYEGDIYRPPGEWKSYLLQTTIGCSNNTCTFCGMYLDKKFHIRPMADILEDIRMARAYYGDVERVFLCDGDAIIMRTQELLTILEALHRAFPSLQRVTTYAGPRSTLTKTPEELRTLREAGLTRAYLGVETGCDALLKQVKKGVDAAQMLEAGVRLREAGMDLWVMVILGLAGTGEPSRRHMLDTAAMMNEMKPRHLSALTLTLDPGTELYQDYRAGRFHPITPRESLLEAKLLLENLTVDPLHFTCNHASNYLPLKGGLPEDRDRFLAMLDRALAGEQELRPEWSRGF